MLLISAETYVSPRTRALTAEEQEVRRISYALKIPTTEALAIASRVLAPMVNVAAAIYPGSDIVLMPVPGSTNGTDVNRIFANELAKQIRAISKRCVSVLDTVVRKQAVESSCTRRKHGLQGLTVEQHGMIAIPGTVKLPRTCYFFVDNVLTTGNTLEACRQALGFGDAVVYASK